MGILAFYSTYHANITCRITKSVVTRRVFRSRSGQKMRWLLGLCPRPRCGAYSTPQIPLTGLRGRGRKGKRMEGTKEEGEGEGKGKGRSGKEGRGRERVAPSISCQIRGLLVLMI